MTTWIEQSVSLITSNDPTTGADNLNPGFSTWSFEVANGLTIPHEAKNATLECPQAAVWYSSHIIVAGGPDKLNFIYENAPAPPVPLQVVIPPGLWSLEALNDEINYQLIDLTLASDAGDWVQIDGITATGKTRVIFSVLTTPFNFTIDFTDADTLFELLGFNQGDLVATAALSPVYPQTRVSPNQATFDSTGSYNFSTNLCGGVGIPTNSTQGNVLANILIDVAAGSQIIYRPPVPPRVDVDHLIGKTINQANFSITNENGGELIFGGETNVFLMVLRWLIPITAPEAAGGNYQERLY